MKTPRARVQDAAMPAIIIIILAGLVPVLLVSLSMEQGENRS